MTLVEVLVSVVLLTLVTGTLATVFVTAFDTSRPTVQRVRETTDAQLIAAYLIRDGQAAGGTNPLTAAIDPTLGVKKNGAAACGSGTAILQFSWLDRSTTANTMNVAAYFFDSANHDIVRSSCVGGGSAVNTTLGRAIANATGACSPTDCSSTNSLPNTVSLTITATNQPKNAPTPYSYVLTANVRPQAQGAQNTGNSNPVPLLALGGSTCNSGGASGLALSGNANVRVYGEVVVNSAGAPGCPAMTASGSVTYNPGGTEILNPGSCTGNACPIDATTYPGALSDPFAGLPIPSIVPSTCPSSGSNPGPIAGNVYPPGVYPNAVSITGDATFQTGGTFVFCQGLSISGNGTVTGTNVLFYFMGGTLQVSGGTQVNFDDSGTYSTGPGASYPGLLIWQTAADTTTLSIAGTANESYLGTIYAPGAEVDVSGNAGTKQLTSVIAKSLVITGNNQINIGSAPSNPLSIVSPNSGTLPSWTQTVAYNTVTIKSTGGSGINNWIVTGLPAGLTLTPGSPGTDATITGTPTAAGAFTVSITVKDSLGDQATKTYGLTINAAPTITGPASLPSWDVNRDYPGTAVMTGSGGTPNYTWSATGLPTGLSINPSTGVISVDPSATGTFSPTITLTDGVGATATRTYNNVQINAQPTITGPVSLQNWTSGQTYPSTTITKSGGTGPFVWTQSGLPPGLTINSGTGVVSGTPNAPGPYSATITVTDGAGVAASHPYSLTINPSPSIGTVSLPNGEQNVPYSTTLTPGSGGTPPYTWSQTGLPATLSLNASTGVISGTPTAVTTYSVAVTLTDSTGAMSNKTFSLVIQPPPSITGPASIPSWTITRDYPAKTVTVTGGITPYAFAASGLPPGLSINTSTGVISGTPTSTGTFTVTINVTDAAGVAAPPITLPAMTINGLPSVSTASLPGGEQSVVYASTTMAASGGTSPYTWSGSGLPPGLTITSGGVLSGTPTVGGTYSATITATDTAGATASKPFTISILPPPTVLSPATLPDWTINRLYPTTTFTGTGGTSPYTFTTTPLPAGLTLTSAGVLSGTPTAAASTTFTVTIHDALGATTTQSYTVVIHAAPVITTTSLPVGSLNATYPGATIATTGGTTPFAWSAPGMPPGLAIDPATGAISGTPTSTGTFTPTITLQDAAGATATKPLTIVVTPRPTISSVQLTDTGGGGHVVGRIDKGDQIIVTFSQQMNVTSFCSTWSGDTTNQSLSANGDVTVTVTNGGATNDVLTVSSATCTFNFGSLDLGSTAYVSSNATFNGNGGSASTIAWTASTHVLTITLGSETGTSGTVASSTPVYTSSPSITDSGNGTISNSPFTLSSGAQF